jgi:hypothetical protein
MKDGLFIFVLGTLAGWKPQRNCFLLLLFLNENRTLVEYLEVTNIRLKDKWVRN